MYDSIRKLSVTARTDQDEKAPVSTAEEAQLQREEDEMLAINRLLRQVDERDVLVMARHILNNTTIVAGVEESNCSSDSEINNTTSLSNGSSSTSSGASDHSRQHPSWARCHNNTQLQQQEAIAGVVRNNTDAAGSSICLPIS